MWAKRGTPATFVFVGDTDGLDGGLLGEAVAVGVRAVVGVVLGVADGADDATVGDATADDATADDATADEATADEATADEAAATGDVPVAGDWLASAEALELRGWELVHPDANRAKTVTTEHPATLAVNITNRPCSVRSAHSAAASGTTASPVAATILRLL
jgi:hypothetical protein